MAAEQIVFEKLQPSMFENQPMWLDFFTALSEVIQEQIREPIGELEDIRHIVETTDPFIIANTIKQLGFDIPADLIQSNIDRLSRSVYMLSLFHEISGTHDFKRSIAYVLGRDVEVTNLFTNDYTNFYAEPQGPLLQDGGDWYGTTHIDLGMELLPDDRGLILPIGKTLEDRLLAAYFEFAPINQVVNKFYFITNIQAELDMTAAVFVNPVHYRTVGDGVHNVLSVRSLAPISVESESSIPLQAQALFSQVPCYDVSTIAYGTAASVKTDADITALTTVTHTATQNITLSIPAGQFGYIASPVELGNLTFTDSNGFSGGWDGATWVDGTVGATTGPIVVKRLIDSQFRDWNLYRTDFPALGSVTYTVTVQYNRKSSCDVVDKTVILPPAPPPTVCTPTSVPIFPIYGTGLAGYNSGSVLDSLQYALPSTSNQPFTLNIDNGKYGYFAYPIALGMASFTDSNGLQGGWDGAGWPTDGSIGTTTGPVAVTRTLQGNTVSYYLYRTDFPSLGSTTFNVTFEHAGTALSITVSNCPTNCVSGYPVIAQGNEGLITDAGITAAIVQTLTTTANTAITTTPTDAQFAYFVYPVELGLATFTDSNGFIGGWDGATWAVGDIGSTYGPKTISRTVNTVTSNWYVYRTDFAGIDATFNVAFTSGNLCVGLNIVVNPVSCVVSSAPRYGTGFELATDTQLNTLTAISDMAQHSFTINVPAGQYGYFASPAALGKVTFTDTNGFVGGWDGARWPVDVIGSDAGPSLVMHTVGTNDVPWYLYRTDFPALGSVTYTVSYENNLSIGTLGSNCQISIPHASDFVKGVAPTSPHFPVYGLGVIGIHNDSGILSLTSQFVSNANATFTINVTSGHYGYFATPSNLGIAEFTNTSTNLQGGWDGASWPSDGSIGIQNGPIAVLRNIGGIVQTWYLYRTDFPGIGNATYKVSFGHAEENTGYTVIRLISPTWSTDRPDLVTFDLLGVAHFNKVTVDTIVHVTASYQGVNDTVAITLKATAPALLHATLTGPDTLVGGQSGIFGMDGYYSDGFYRPVVGAIYSVLNPYARFTNETLSSDNPPVDQTLYVQGSYTNADGSVVQATGNTLLTHVNTNLYVMDMSIAGPATIIEGTTVQYVANVLYSNGTSKPELVLWETSTPSLYIDQQGNATANRPNNNYSATITATFQFNGAKTVSTKPVNVTIVTVTPKSLTIAGPVSVSELSAAQYQARLTWSDNSTIYVAASWSTSKFSIDNTGLLSTGSVSADTPLTINAIANGLSAQASVTVHVTQVTLEHITIIGPDNVLEGVNATYRCLAHYSTGKDVEVTATMSVTGNPSFVSLSAGVLSVFAPTASSIELVASYTAGLVTYTQKKLIVVIPKIALISGLTIAGPSEVLESKRISLSATALYTDGTTHIVQPQWSVMSPDVTNDPEAAADVVSPGVLQGRIVDKDTKVIVVATYFKEVAYYPIVVKDYTPPGPDVPITYRIDGPDQITTSQIGSYTLLCKFQNCPSVLSLSNDWALDVDNTVAIIDNNGYLRSINHQPATVVVNATWSYNGHAIQDKKTVLIVDDVFINQILLSGPSTVDKNSTAQFSVETFTNKQTLVQGQGAVPGSGQVVWSVTGSSLVTIDQTGLLKTGDLQSNVTVTISAVFNDGHHSAITATSSVLVHGAPPAIVSANLLGSLSTLEGGVLQFSVEVFRAGMTTLPGTGLPVNPSTLVFAVTSGSIDSTGKYTTPSNLTADATSTLTITGVYENYSISISKTITVQHKVAIAALFTGPSSIATGGTGTYSVEVFYTGETVIAGHGRVNPPEAVFSLVSAPSAITLANRVVTVPSTFTSGASYTMQVVVGTVTKTIAVTTTAVMAFQKINARALSLPAAYNFGVQSGTGFNYANGFTIYDANNVLIAGCTSTNQQAPLVLNPNLYSGTGLTTYPLHISGATGASTAGGAINYNGSAGNFILFLNNSKLYYTYFDGSAWLPTTYIDLSSLVSLTAGYAYSIQSYIRPYYKKVSDGTEFIFIQVTLEYVKTGLPVLPYYGLRVYKIVGNSLQFVQEISLPTDGVSGTISRIFVFDAAYSNFPNDIMDFCCRLQLSTGASLYNRVSYIYDGSSFTESLPTYKPNTLGFYGCMYYSINSQIYCISQMCSVITNNTQTPGQMILSSVDSTTGELKTVQTIGTATPVSGNVGTQTPAVSYDNKYCAILVSSTASHISSYISLYSISQSTGQLTFMRYITYADMGLPAISGSSVNEIKFMPDNKTLVLKIDIAPTATSGGFFYIISG